MSVRQVQDPSVVPSLPVQPAAQSRARADEARDVSDFVQVLRGRLTPGGERRRGPAPGSGVSRSADRFASERFATASPGDSRESAPAGAAGAGVASDASDVREGRGSVDLADAGEARSILPRIRDEAELPEDERLQVVDPLDAALEAAALEAAAISAAATAQALSAANRDAASGSEQGKDGNASGDEAASVETAAAAQSVPSSIKQVLRTGHDGDTQGVNPLNRDKSPSGTPHADGEPQRSQALRGSGPLPSAKDAAGLPSQSAAKQLDVSAQQARVSVQQVESQKAESPLQRSRPNTAPTGVSHGESKERPLSQPGVVESAVWRVGASRTDSGSTVRQDGAGESGVLGEVRLTLRSVLSGSPAGTGSKGGLLTTADVVTSTSTATGGQTPELEASIHGTPEEQATFSKPDSVQGKTTAPRSLPASIGNSQGTGKHAEQIANSAAQTTLVNETAAANRRLAQNTDARRDAVQTQFFRGSDKNTPQVEVEKNESGESSGTRGAFELGQGMQPPSTNLDLNHFSSNSDPGFEQNASSFAEGSARLMVDSTGLQTPKTLEVSAGSVNASRPVAETSRTDFWDQVRELIQRVRSENPSHISVEVRLQDGATVGIELRMRPSGLEASFRSESPALLRGLESQWAGFLASEGPGLQIASAAFENRSGLGNFSDSGRNGRELREQMEDNAANAALSGRRDGKPDGRNRGSGSRS